MLAVGRLLLYVIFRSQPFLALPVAHKTQQMVSSNYIRKKKITDIKKNLRNGFFSLLKVDDLILFD